MSIGYYRLREIILAYIWNYAATSSRLIWSSL